MKSKFFGKQSFIVAVLSVSLMVYSSAGATLVNVINYSFEQPTLADGVWSMVANGWVVSGFSGVWNPTTALLSQGPTDGLQVGYSNENGLGLSQTLSSELTASTQYTLMVDVLSRTDSATHKSSVLQLRTEDDIILSSASIGSIAAGGSALLTTTYWADASNPYLGKKLKIALLAGGVQSDWDNVRLDATTSTVPLPSTVWLLGSGLLALFGIRKRFNNLK